MRNWLAAATLGLGLIAILPFFLPRGVPAPSEEARPAPTTRTVAEQLTLDSTPTHAHVVVDGRSLGTTPVVLHGHDQQVFEVTLDAPGRLPLHRYVLLRRDQKKQVLALEPVAVARTASTVSIPLATHPLPRVTTTLAPTVDLHLDQAALDERARTLPDAQAQTVQGLAEALTAGVSGQSDKARVIYVWIASHIRYDVEAFFAQAFLDTRPDRVLQARRACCGGYASLYDGLATAAGLESKIITGNSKGLEEINPANRARTNHAWNAVRVDGQWKLVDATWGSGALDRQHHFVARLDDYFFLTPPQELIYTHFPDDPQWQGLPAPMSWAEYQALPWTDADFWKCGLSFDTPKTSHLEVDGEVHVRVVTPPGVVLTGRVEDSNGPHKEWCFSQRDGNDFDVQALFPEAGHYKLRLFTRVEKESANLYKGAVAFDVQARSAAADKGFPLVYRDFLTDHAFLVEPMEGHLPAGREQAFKVRVPDAQSVNVVSGTQWTALKQDGDTWSGHVAVEAGEVLIVPVFPNEEKHRSILRYVAQ